MAALGPLRRATYLRCSCALLITCSLVVSPARATEWLGQCWNRFWCSRSEAVAHVTPPGQSDSEGALLGYRAPRVPPAANNQVARSSLGCRECLRQWSLDRVEFQYGLTLPENIEEEPPDLPLVVFLHGLNSRPEDLNTLVERVQDVGLPCATYRYPNDQALEQSAAQFAQSLRRLPGITRRRPLSLITHSMGGLVARAVVEDPMLDPGTIRHLVMIAPPNHGSELARYAISLDVVEYVSSRQRRQEAGPLVGAFADGFSEAVRDLRPESKFLQQLNSRPRNPRVHYSLVIGTQGVVPPKRISKVRRALAWSAQHCSWMQACEDQWVECVASVPELIDGSGDGVVAVHRSRLKGVDDVLLTPVSHGDLLRPAADVHVDQVHRWILERLTKDSGVTQ